MTNSKTVWLTENADVANELKNQGLPVITFLFFPVWQILRAETIIIDTSQFSLAVGRFSIVQLWHGTGFKTIGTSSFKNKFQAMLGRRHFSKYRMIASTSPNDVKRKQEGFGNPSAFITGSPRNDLFFDEKFSRQDYKKKLDLTKFDKAFLYAPTFRDHGTFEPFSKQMWAQLEKFMVSRNYIFIVKKHPSDREFKVPSNLENIIDMTVSIGDIQELLAASDLLITDYSSIVTDYVLSSNPVIFYTFDIEPYLESRPLFYDFESVVPGPFARNESELLALISDDHWFEDENYQKKYTEFVSRYHTYQDGHSCQRVLSKLGVS